MNNKLLTLVITLTIGIILTASLLVPVINDAQDGQRITYNNVGLNANLVGTEEVTYSWDAATGITIGTDVIAPNAQANAAAVLVMTDSGFMKTNFNNTTAAFYEFDGTVGAGADITAATITVDPSTKTVTLSDISASTTIDDTSFNYEEWALIPAVNGDYVFWVPYSTSKVIHQGSDSQIYSVYRSGVTWAVSFKGSEATANLNSPTYTTDFAGSPVSGYNGLVDYSLGTNSTDDYTITVSSTAYPAEIVAMEKSATGVSANEGSQIISLLGVIPILVIVGLLLIAVRAVVKKD